MSLGANAAAAGFFERALNLAPQDAPERAGLLAACGRARFLADWTGTELLIEAVDLFEVAGYRERAARAAVDLASSFHFSGRSERRDEYVDRALALTADSPNSPARAKTLVARIAYLMLAGEFSKAVDLGRDTLPLVEQMGLGPERVRLLDVIGVSLAYMGDIAGLSWSERAAEVAREGGYLAELIGATNNLRTGQLSLGLIDEADATLDAYRDRVTRFGTLLTRRWLATTEAETYYLRGRWDEALALLDEDIARSERGSPFYLEPVQRARRSLIRAARGDTEGPLRESEHAVALAVTAKDPQLLAPALAFHARIAGDSGHPRAAAESFSNVLAIGASAITTLYTESSGEGLVTLALLARDFERQGEVEAMLGTLPRTPWIDIATAILHGETIAAADALDRLRAFSAAAYTRLRAGRELIAMGRTDDGRVQLRKAIAFHRTVGATAYVREAERSLAATARPTG
jgi:tetratricopeptide (TPR) repeat protein